MNPLFENETKDLCLRLPSRNDGCEKCYIEITRRRRRSTIIPSYNTCECGGKIYEIHELCLDCAEKNDSCPWCLEKPWKRKSQDEDEIIY